MKRILSATMAAIGSMTGLSALENRLLSHQSYRNTDPRAARHWHNPADPVQADRIEAAAAKRERKADKLDNWANTCWHNNPAHDGRLSLYTFHVAH